MMLYYNGLERQAAMRICIYGAGAIGGYVGVLLARGGADVSLIARGPHLAAIRQNGLTVRFKDHEQCAWLPASDDAAEFGPQDYVIVALKAHQAWQAAEKLQPLLGRETAVVTMQNGIPWWYFYGLKGQYENHRLSSVDPGDRQWNAITPERVIGATVYQAAEIIEPGVIKHTYGDKLGLGEPSGEETARTTTLTEVLNAGGIRARQHKDIRSDIWLKLWGNLCFNPISALTHATLDVVATDPGTRRIARLMMSEAETIGRSLGAEFRVDITRRIDGAAGVGAHKTSMLQDLEKGRTIELDALLTVVQEMGTLTGVATPVIDMVLALTQQMGRIAGVYPAYQ